MRETRAVHNENQKHSPSPDGAHAPKASSQISELKLGARLHMGADGTRRFSARQVGVFLSALVLVPAYFIICPLLVHKSDRVFLSNAAPWLRDIYMVKDAINELPTSKQRVLVFGGSNNLFGFNGAMIEANANVRFINYGTHAGLPLNYQVDRIMQHARAGDVVFLSVVFEAYAAREPRGDHWYVHNMLTWQKDYRKYIRLQDEIMSYLANDVVKSLRWLLRRSASKQEVQEFIEKNIAGSGADSAGAVGSRNLLDSGVEFDELGALAESSGIAFTPCQNPNYAGYDYKSISAHGDFCGQSGSLMLNAHSGYLDADMKVSAFFLQEFARLREWAAANDIKLYLLYPPTMENPSFSMQDSKTMEKIENLTSQLAEHGIEFVGEIADFHFERKYFYDTAYHLNDKGAQLRSAAFIRILRSLGIGG